MKRIISVLLSVMLFAFALPLLTFAEEAAPLSLTFADSKSIDINSPVSATLVAPEGMEKAEFYVENTLVDTLTGDGSLSYNIELDLGNAPVLGNTNIVVKAYAYEVFKISVPVNLVRLKAEANVFSENFNTFTSGTWPSTVHGYIETANGTPLNQMGPYVHAEGDTALKVTFPDVYNKSSTYMEKDNLAVSKNNILKIKFDAYFSSEKENMRVELRDLNGGYPQYEGAGMGSIALFGSGSALYGGGTYEAATWYSVLIEIDLSTPVGATGQGAFIYIKGGEFDDYTLISYMPGFSCDGFKKIRFTCLSAGGNNEYILIDNVEISKQEFEERWFYKAEFEDENGGATAYDAVKTNGAKAILKFSEDMGENLNGKVYIENDMGDIVKITGSYNSENKTYTAEISDKLLNGGKYFIKISEGVISAAGNKANSTLGTAFYAEEYPLRVKSISYSAGKAVATIENKNLVDGNMALVLITYSGDKCIDSNMVLLSSDTESYTVSISKESGQTISAYIVDSLSTLKILNIYSE